MAGADVAADAQPRVSRAAHHLLPALVAALAVGLLVAAQEVGGDPARLGAVAVLQLVLVVSWVAALGSSGGSLGTAVIGIAAAAGADAAFLLPDRPSLGGLLVVLGPAFTVVVLGQMLRRRRRDVVGALAGGVLLVCAVSALATYLLLGGSSVPAGETTTALLAIGVALVVGYLVDAVLPRPQLAPDVPRGLLGLVLAVGAATALAWFRRDAGDVADALSAATLGAVLGSVAALVAVAGSYVAVEAAPGRGRALVLPFVQALLPIAACTPVAVALQTAL